MKRRISLSGRAGSSRATHLHLFLIGGKPDG
jgi:hypothetical protein